MTESSSSPAKAEIMTLDEVAARLQVSPKTVYEWVRKGEIPGGKVGNGWRFQRREIERWAARRRQAQHSSPVVAADVIEKLPPGRILLMEEGRKRAVLEVLIDCLALAPEVGSREALAAGIFEREALMSTGIGFGVGVPHCRLPSISAPVMAAAVVRAGIPDYESLDDEPVRLVFMIAAGADQHAEHLRILAAISRRIKEPAVRKRLCAVADGDEFRRILGGE